nr:MAG TPA: hypothetical protein [Caudoviricetes sp.]
MWFTIVVGLDKFLTNCRLSVFTLSIPILSYDS